MRRSVIPLILAAALLAPAILGEPTPRRVVTDLRIESARVKKALPPSVLDRLRNRVARSLAEMAKKEFPYLEWVPKSASDPPGAPTLALLVFDGQVSPTSPCSAKVRWRLVAEIDAVERFSSAPDDLDNGCNPRPRFQNEADFETQLTGLDDVQRILKANPNDPQSLHSKFLRNVPLVSRLDADEGAQKLFLPLAADRLLADKESKLRVDFWVDQHIGNMELQPVEPAGDRMVVEIYVLKCHQIAAPCASVVEPAGAKWLPSLPGLLGRSRDLGVFMETYIFAPLNRAEVRTEIGGAQ
jgi:hypothetical protein